MFELIEKVRYPDESNVGINDKDSYYDVKEGLELMIASSDGQMNSDARETLNELERRWSEKQEAVSELQNKWKERQLALRAVSI